MALRSTKTDDLKQRDYSDIMPGLSFVRDAAPDSLPLNRGLQIASILQTTLDINKIIELFAEEIKTSVPYASMSYRNLKHGIDITLGEPGRHACTYRLVVAGDLLGELTVTRRKRFANSDTVLLERLLCSLIYPLRNALMYSEALRAAFIDPLTGVNNRTTMSAVVKREIELARRHGTPLSLIILDIDHFKVINDTYGHATGDCVIKALADCVTDCIRRTDILFRYGGEEFTVLLSNTSTEGALLLAERIRRTVEKIQCPTNNLCLNMTISLGVAYLIPEDDDKQLFERADTALYRAKFEGRNCVRLAAV